MREWAQVLDAHEVVGDELRTWYELWSLKRQATFSIEIEGASPLDIGHIVAIDHGADVNQPALSFFEFEVLDLRMREKLAIPPVSYKPGETRAFQDQDWLKSSANRDVDYARKLEQQQVAERGGGQTSFLVRPVGHHRGDRLMRGCSIRLIR